MRKILLSSPALAILFLLISPASAMELEPSLAFEFNDPESVADWERPHSISDVEYDDGSLSLRLAGNDPYIFAPEIRIKSELARYIEIALDAPPHTYVTAYFVTEEDPNWGGKKRIRFGTTRSSGRSVLRFDTILHQLWTGTITGFRLDLDSGENPRAKINVDYIRRRR